MNDDGQKKQPRDFTTTLSLDASPRAVFDAINDVRGWWTGQIDGPTDAIGGEFTYRHEQLHRSTQRVVELVPGERVVWLVSDAHLSFVDDHREWNGTRIVFDLAAEGGRTELRFTHEGLAPGRECYAACSKGWSFYVERSLRALIETGAGDPGARQGR